MNRGNQLSVAFALGLMCALTFLARPAAAQDGESIKPYVLVIMDTSGSMNGSTGNGPSSCGASDSRLDHAKCALQQVTDAHADIQFGLAQFRPVADNATSCAACGDAFSCQACNESNGDGCTGTMNSPDRLQLLVPFVESANDDIHRWVDFSCGPAGCDLDPSANPELRAIGGNYTPLGGVLRGARRFFEGTDPNIDTTDNLDAIFSTSVSDPIGDDPLALNFISPGRQCRPYVVVLLTDGEETCEEFDDGNTLDDTVGVAADLLAITHGGNGLEYRVELKPIGFGTGVAADCEADGASCNGGCDLESNAWRYQVEKMARAGGKPGDGEDGECEGFYADDEAQLVNAFNDIIADSILVEVCDGADNDCDGVTDEGFELFCNLRTNVLTNTLCDDPGDPCDGVDDNCNGTTDDELTNACGLCGDVPEEICNDIDDDCDGSVDEGDVCGDCVPTGEEICDGEDNDCDGIIDGMTQECGTDVGECSVGVETCVGGFWINCTGDGITDEICDGLDNNCDGTVDGFAEECSEDINNVPPFNGPCQPGFRVCEVVPEGTPNSFGACQGEIGPSTESCDGIDNDCDGDEDEGTGGADCSSACGLGETVCVEGELECDSGPLPLPDEICNNIDDDCDGLIDEDIPDGGDCFDGGLCLPGILKCIGGQMVCTGGEAPGLEICDCLDNDCDDLIDEEPPSLCPTGASCTSCQCAYPCGQGEFPCPTGRYCGEGDFCLVDPCFNVNCGPDAQGSATTCVEGECVDSCSLVNCPTGTACRASDGTCQFDDCRGFPELCAVDEFCVIDECVDNRCTGIVCPSGDYCLEGECIGSCADVTCAAGQSCVLGECTTDACNGSCTDGQVCGSDGTCQNDPCNSPCPTGQVCDPSDGECIQDPCLGVDCPEDQVCSLGSCFQAGYGTDAGVAIDHDYVAPGGGGGCSSTGQGGGGLAAFLVLLAFALVGRLRHVVPLIAVLMLAASGCSLDGYCLDCEEDNIGIIDGGTPMSDAIGDGGNGDGGPGADACVSSGLEQCDGLDNDCDGEIDNSAMPGVGDVCSVDEGECVAGTTVCEDGEIVCGGGAVLPSLELCNLLDDDCDGAVDEFNPEGGVLCGTNLGECVAGTQTCIAGEIICQDEVTGGPESCNGLDDDCDGFFDEDIATGGDCGPDTDLGLCAFGTLTCIGGAMQCVGATYATPEMCDTADHDCDGSAGNGFDLANDAKNCLGCGNVCQADFAFVACGTLGCEIANCESSYFDRDGLYSNGCEIGPCTFRGNEICNGIDDDCDGEVDEGVNDNPPALCDDDGECFGSAASCIDGSWVCSYQATVSLDLDGNIIPEVDCDGRDNDCDGSIDEAFPTLGDVCDDSEVGACLDLGTIVCNAGDDGVECNAVDDEVNPTVETTCDGLDNDCDGSIDEDDVQEWIDLGAFEMFKYEASRPDSTAVDQGFSIDAAVCSNASRVPWTNVTQPQAEAACTRIGARLCTEAEWQSTCETNNIGPAQQQGSNGLIVFEAEDTSLYSTVPGGGDNWVPTSAQPGYSGIAAMVVPDGSTGDEESASNLNGAPRIDYNINFANSGTHYLWVRLWADDNDNDSMWFSFNDTDYDLSGANYLDLDDQDHESWVWVNFYNNDSPIITFDVPAPGAHTLSFYHRNDGLIMDRIIVTTNPNYVPLNAGPPAGCQWSYANDCRIYEPNTCNGKNYDGDLVNAGDQDVLLATGSMNACYADWGVAGDVYDMSGNVKEWTVERTPGVNPIRGGSYNNTANGTSCQFDFLTAGDAFFLPNIGFRCCR